MLSEAHAVFDPLGLFSLFTIVPKIILQQCWKSELKWDQPVPEDIVKKFVEWQSQIPELLSVRIPSVKKLIEHKWWEGPSFLWGEEASWNQFDPIFDEEEINKELKKTVNIAVNSTKDNFMDKLERYGDYHRIVRIVAYLLRFKRKTVSDESRPGQHDKMSKEISVEEFEEAEKVVLRHIQLISFGRDDKRINKLNAFTDEYGLYRIKSQLYFGEDDYDTRCPIVLPGENQVVKLLIRKEHEMMSHAGIQTTQQLVRRRFWILKGKRTIRSIISACATCRRYNSKRVQTESIPIPATRIGSTPAFGVIGVDLAGPLTESGGKKIWVVLYICAVYRAVHLELTKTVSTEGFLDTFRRFVARRGRPSIVYSDNGLNFVGCNNLFKKVNWNDVLRYATVQRIKWNFNPPTAAFWGGWWERLVGLMKQLIRKVLGDKTVSYEELQTVICEVESAMNLRPLTAISEESGLVPITPAKFMCDNASCLFVPEADIVDSKFLKESHLKVQNSTVQTHSMKDNRTATKWLEELLYAFHFKIFEDENNFRVTAYGDAILSRRRVFEWYKRFKEGREETADNERSGRPSTSTTPEKVDKVLELVREDRRITVREVAEEAGISFGSTQSIMKDILGVRRLNAVLVPKDLTFDQKNARKETASLNLEATTDDPELLKRVIPGDETWIYGFDSETTQQASEWRFKNEPRPKKARKTPSKVKVMLTVFFDYQGIVHHEFQQQGSTITADSYLGVLRRLREAFRQKRPELWRSKSWILHHDKAAAHTALKISKFLQDHSTSVFPQPPYSSDLAPCDFFLFGKLKKKKLKGRKFQSIEEIKVESKKAMKAIPKTDYQRCFDTLKDNQDMPSLFLISTPDLFIVFHVLSVFTQVWP
ncbi:hypothetical protein LAZ67_5003594 [Cordylochernes scorpioides]|uniref:Integrase catalytic domain-containing protein n=1 Tax=Cordylochernes scorpioides TaxID=51811 RepID=A0ABY6KHC6_9ARAC|nr:hypothetical protein LAZ67_5003594 [Cordylochernes scorpioides]